MDNPTPASATPSAEAVRAFWYGLINYEQRTATPADLKLDRMRALLARLGNPHHRLRIIHIAGTKGKGSTSAMLASILRRAGYRTGLFTSPHLVRVEERFQVAGQPISADELTVLLGEVRDCVLARPAEPPPTFFEVATAVGLLHFVRRRVDAAILEVGLGGRFDSTNVCRPLVSIITSISFDHTRQLGDRLALIAREKAGILKACRPALSGATVPEARAVIEYIAAERRAPLEQLGVDFHYSYVPGLVTAEAVRKPRVRITSRRRAWPEMELNLLGEHQAANAALAVVCTELLRREGLSLPDAAVAEGLAQVDWPARMEVLRRRPLVLLDCAHNVASAQAVVETLRTSFPQQRRLLIFAGSSDKDLPGMLRVLGPHFQHVWLARYTNNPRSTDPEQLAGWLRQVSDVPATVAATATAAWQQALAAAGPDDLICLTGSIFLAGEMRPVVLGQTSES
jgi:dihydrofolate synthase/folylpolyglutamate synthase